MTLYINSCARKDSNTDKIARVFLNKYWDSYEELNLYKENLLFLNRDRLEKRTLLIDEKDYSDKMFDYAKQFASANNIIISAPYWDMSFPAILKVYIENICVSGITFRYDKDGTPIGLCKAKTLTYIVTAGGFYIPDYSFEYFKSLAKMWGIPEVKLIKAEMLDVWTSDANDIIKKVISEI